MELQHAIKLLSENRILDKIDIVDSPAYHELIRIPALRGVGYFMEQMQEACLDLEESGLEASLWKAKMLLLDIEKAIEHEEREQQEVPPLPPLEQQQQGEPLLLFDDTMQLLFKITVARYQDK
ncbi:hypothetical protein BGX31_009944 [Mortierella sp. GBA43]|nr:hypothetical protein BGX31_009944 [Mortierella sp. GBA43]